MPEGLVKATGSETVQFNRDIAPVLVTHCVGCHGVDQQSGQLRMDDFGGFLKGGASGELFESGKPEESLIVKRLRGIDGDRMPQDKDALPAETIAKVETWIKEGAKYDGADPSAPLKVVVEALAAGRLTHEELTAKRLAQAQKIWQLAAPDEQAELLQTANFILIGNVSARPG